MNRPRVFDMTARPVRRPERAWWQQIETDEEFHSHLERMSTTELESLISEVNAAKASTGLVLTDLEADDQWRHRARRALSLIGQRRALLAAELKKRIGEARQEKEEMRLRIVSEARALVAAGDVASALLLALDWIEGFGRGPNVPAVCPAVTHKPDNTDNEDS